MFADSDGFLEPTVVPSFLLGMQAKPSASKGKPCGQWAGEGKDSGLSKGTPRAGPGFCWQQLMKCDTDPIPKSRRSPQKKTSIWTEILNREVLTQ